MVSLASQNILVLLQLFGLGLFLWQLVAALKKFFSSDVSSFRSYTDLENSILNKYWSPARIINWLFSGFVFLLLCTLVLYLLPSLVMNHHDDYGVYLTPIVQIIETGSFSIDKFDTTLNHSFGGLSFLQALSIIEFDPTVVNLFDAVICFCVSLVFLYEYGVKNQIDKRIILLAIVFFLVFNSQYVSISALYSISLLTLGLLLSCLKLTNHYIDNSNSAVKLDLGLHGLVALFLTGLVLLKYNPMPFILLCAGLNTAVHLCIFKNKIFILKSTALIAALCLLFFSPWVIKSVIKAAESVTNRSAMFLDFPDISSTGVSYWPYIFSTVETHYGNSYFVFATPIVTLTIILIVSLFFYLLTRNNSLVRLIPYFCSIVAVVILHFFFTKSYGIDLQSGLRLSLPIAILALSPLIVSSLSTTLGSAKSFPGRSIIATGYSLVIAFFAINIGQFSNNFIDRAILLKSVHTLISYQLTQEYIDASAYSLGDVKKTLLRQAQSSIPEGERIFSMTPLAFQLDHRRNGIVHAIYATPGEAEPEQYWEFLQDEGFNYLLWDYNGHGGAHYTAGDWVSLEALTEHCPVLFHQGDVITLDLKGCFKPGTQPQN